MRRIETVPSDKNAASDSSRTPFSAELGSQLEKAIEDKNSQQFNAIFASIHSSKIFFEFLKRKNQAGVCLLDRVKQNLRADQITNDQVRPYELLYQIETWQGPETHWFIARAKECNVLFAADDITFLSHAILYGYRNLVSWLSERAALLVFSNKNANDIVTILERDYIPSACLKILKNVHVVSPNINLDSLIQKAKKNNRVDLQTACQAIETHSATFSSEATIDRQKASLTVMKRLKTALESMSALNRIAVINATDDSGCGILWYAVRANAIFSFLAEGERNLASRHPVLNEILWAFQDFSSFIKEHGSDHHTEEFEILKMVLECIPSQARRSYFFHWKLGNILDFALTHVKNPEVIRVLLEALPASDCFKAVTSKFLHRLAKNHPKAFTIAIELITDERITDKKALYDLLKATDDDSLLTTNVLDRIKKMMPEYTKLLESLKTYEAFYQLETSLRITIPAESCDLQFAAGDLTILGYAISQQDYFFSKRLLQAAQLTGQRPRIVFSKNNLTKILKSLGNYYEEDCVNILQSATLEINHEDIGQFESLYKSAQYYKYEKLKKTIADIVTQLTLAGQALPKWLEQLPSSVATTMAITTAVVERNAEKQPAFVAALQKLKMELDNIPEPKREAARNAVDSAGHNILVYARRLDDIFSFLGDLQQNIADSCPALKETLYALQDCHYGIRNHGWDKRDVVTECLKVMVGFYPKSLRLAAFRVANYIANNEKKITDYTQYKNSKIMQVILEALPDDDRLAAVTNSNSTSAFLVLWSRTDIKTFEVVLELITDDRITDRRTLYSVLTQPDAGCTVIEMAKMHLQENSQLLERLKPYGLLYQLGTNNLVTTRLATSTWLKTQAESCDLQFNAGDMTILSQAILHGHRNFVSMILDKNPKLILSKNNIKSLVSALTHYYEEPCVNILEKATFLDLDQQDVHEFDPLLKMAQNYKYTSLQNYISNTILPQLAPNGVSDTISLPQTSTTTMSAFELLSQLQSNTSLYKIFSTDSWLDKCAESCDAEFSQGDVTFLSQGILYGRKKFTSILIGRQPLIIFSSQNISILSDKLAEHCYDEVFCCNLFAKAKIKTSEQSPDFLMPLYDMANKREFDELKSYIAHFIEVRFPQQQPPQWVRQGHPINTNVTHTNSPQNWQNDVFDL